MTAVERRRSQRFYVQLPGTVQAGSEERAAQEGRNVIIRNISADGVYLSSNARINLEDSVQLRIRWPNNGGQSGAVLEASGQVLRVEHLPKKTFGVALQFDQSPWKPKGVQQDKFAYFERLGKIKQYVEENYSQKLGLEAASRIAAMEATYFSTFFHAKVGVPFRDWLSHTRIAKAMDLIAKRDYTLAEVASAVGYSDLRSFERAFKKVVKLKPREFKKSVQA